MINPLYAILVVPPVAVVMLACIPSYRIGAVLNMLASGLTFMAGVSLLAVDRYRSDILIVDDFNIYLVILTTFVAFTSSIFSASYIGHELETGRLGLAHEVIHLLVGEARVEHLAVSGHSHSEVLSDAARSQDRSMSGKMPSPSRQICPQADASTCCGDLRP